MSASNNNLDQELEWVKECLDGNVDCFDYLMKHSEQIVRGMVMNIVHDSTQAEELAQLSFVTAFERLHQFKGESKFSTWVCQIALNKCRDHLRIVKRNRHNIDAEDYSANIEHGNNPEQETATQQRDELLDNAINKLKPNDREIVIFKYVCGYSYDVISQILGCTVQTAKVRSFRARESLKSILEDMGINYG